MTERHIVNNNKQYANMPKAQKRLGSIWARGTNCMPHIGAHAICKYRRTGLKCSITKAQMNLSKHVCGVHNWDRNMSKEMNWSEVHHRAYSLGVDSCYF